MAAIFVFLYLLRRILLPFVIAAALAYIMNPGVRWLQRRFGLRRGVAALPVYIGFLGLLVGLGWPLTTALAQEITAAAAEAPEMIRALIGAALGSGEIRILGETYDAAALSERIMAGLRGWVGGSADALQLVAGGIAFAFGVTLTLVLLLFFLVSGPQLGRGFLWLTPPEHRAYVRSLAVRLDPILMRYFVGLAVILVYSVAVTWIILGPVLGLPKPVLIAVCFGFLELIPVIGPAASAALIGVVALQQESIRVIVALALLVLAERVSIDQIVGPIVLGHAALLHPVVVIFAFLAGGLLFGIVGLVLAVPVAMSLKVVLNDYYAKPIER